MGRREQLQAVSRNAFNTSSGQEWPGFWEMIIVNIFAHLLELSPSNKHFIYGSSASEIFSPGWPRKYGFYCQPDWSINPFSFRSINQTERVSNMQQAGVAAITKTFLCYNIKVWSTVVMNINKFYKSFIPTSKLSA